MTEEEKKAIEDLKDFKSISILYGNTFTIFLEQLKKYQEATDTVLNLIEKLQEENKVFKSALDRETADRSNDLLELQKKDKMIDLMAEELKEHIFILSDGSTITSKKGIIKHFEQKATNDG